MKPSLHAFALTLAAVGSLGAASNAALAQTSGPALKAVTVTTGLVNPWGMAWLPDGRMVVTEKAGRLRIVSADGQQVSEPVAGVPAVDARNQGGLFDVLPAADFANSRRLFLSYAEPGTGDEQGKNGLAVGTALLSADGKRLEQWQVIFRQLPKVVSSGHYGGRLVPVGKDQLFIAAGDRQRGEERGKAQDLAQGHGKIFRIHTDGRVPTDNPFVGQTGAVAATWSLGHRNPQGAALHPETGELWATEHGPQGGDELNVVLKGKNYGWPLVSFGCEYGQPVGNCAPVGGAVANAAFEAPLTTWVPRSIAPSGLVFYTGNRYPEWKGQLFSGALAGQAVWRIKVQGRAVVEREPLPVTVELKERIRDVRQGPDGWLYLLTDANPGRIIRLER